ncbi:hypothetical protein K8089_10205 [Aequorivita sp. F47161]|uniref:Gliding motility-associated protein GldM N-terminal domain-containing protein n=1 Tax=Aequorivita vitellina TaxID=2874475 RepID=A0A9X1QTX6_9FLAO|nr:hypothetical protein [Aequorivita vitellina]MCG2419396.1 hypothetical protein [Aequorivita vitellina]
MKYSSLILLILLIACDSKEQTELPKVNSDYVLYGLMIEKYSSSTQSIEDEMYSVINKNDLSKLKNAEKYDSLTIEYKLYLESVYQKILEDATTDLEMDYNQDLSNKSITNNMFFSNDIINDYGNEFLTKLEEYRLAILPFVENNQLKYRINLLLTTDDASDRNGYKINYLEYHFRDIPPIAVMFYIKYIQNSIISFENEYFKNLALK